MASGSTEWKRRLAGSPGLTTAGLAPAAEPIQPQAYRTIPMEYLAGGALYNWRHRELSLTGDTFPKRAAMESGILF
jgi:hypothetical protein